MLKLIDRLALWWLDRRGITTVTVNGGHVTVPDTIHSLYVHQGGTVTFPTSTGGRVRHGEWICPLGPGEVLLPPV